jgi:hypothetical protein
MRHVRTVAVARHSAHRGPSRLLIALAALWMVLSLAIGSAMTMDRPSSNGGTTTVTTTVER